MRGMNMKTCKYIGFAGLALLTISSLLVTESAMAIEKAEYSVMNKENDLKYMNEDDIRNLTNLTPKENQYGTIPTT